MKAAPQVREVGADESACKPGTAGRGSLTSTDSPSEPSDLPFYLSLVVNI